MSAQIYGSGEAVLMSTQRTWSPDKGDGWSYVYICPIGKADAFFDAKKAELTTDSISMSKEDGEAKITVQVQDDLGGQSAGTASGADVTWELLGQDISKDLMSFTGRPESEEQWDDFTIQGVGEDNNPATLVPGQMAAVRKGVQLADPSKYGLGAEYKPTKFYRLLMEMGVTEYIRSSMILRKTVSAGRRTTLTGSWVGVDRAWPYSGSTGSPNVGNEIGAILLGQINEHPDATSVGYHWLKKAPTIQQTGRRLFTITQEWWFAGSWSKILYGGDGIGAEKV